MNAKGLHITRRIAAVIILTSGFSCTSHAATPVSWLTAPLLAPLLAPSFLGQVLGQQVEPTMTRQNVDGVLRQAQSAIRNGNLEKAEATLLRAEAANIRYPMWHMGLTPARVRRELTVAKRLSGPSRGSTAKTAAQPTNQVVDPFSPSQSTPAPALNQTARNPALSQQVANTGRPLPMAAPNSSVNSSVASVQLQPHPNGQLRYPTTAANTAANQQLNQQLRGLSAPSLGLGQKAANPFNGAGSPAAASTQSSHLNVNALAPSSDIVPSAMAGDDGSGVEPAYTPAYGTRDSRYGISLTNGQISQPSPQSITVPASANKKQTALGLLQEGRTALASGDIANAEQLARQASALEVSESEFLPNEDKPSALAWAIQQSRQQPPQRMLQTPEQTPISSNPISSNPVSTSHGAVSHGTVGPAPIATTDVAAIHVPEADPTANVQASSRTASADLRFAQLPGSALPSSAKSPGNLFTQQRLPEEVPAPNQAADLLAKGEEALRKQDRTQALGYFQQAWQSVSQLDVPSRQRLEGHLQMLSSGSPFANNRGNSNLSQTSNANSSLLNSASEKTQVVARQLQAEITKRQSEARRVREDEPRKALTLLTEVRQQVTDSDLPTDVREQLVRRVNVSIADVEQYIKQHRAEIELDEQNAAVLAEIDRTRAVKLKVQDQIAEMVDKFNQLLDEQRYEEMQIVAQRLRDLAPDELVVQQVWQTAKFIRREKINRDIADRREQGNWDAWNGVEESSIYPVGIDKGPVYATDWDELTKGRRSSSDISSRLTERELEITRRLKTPVSLRYQERPLSEVMEGLSSLTGVNIHLDPRGLNQEGVTSDTLVTINVTKEISLKSALNLILEPLHLSYMVTDEVLKITSEQLRNGEIKAQSYNVADLVVPIPNFVPSNNMGLQGLLNDAHASLGYGGGGGGFGAPGPMTIVNNPRGGQSNGGDVLAQQFSGSRSGVPTPAVPMGGGPGGLGGGANADFDSLIELIISTVAAESWAENGGGEAEIREFPTTLSLVISQTQAVHEEIKDLLEQLRRHQDLQVTIEVRFIRLNDDFFERIGIDFDLNIEDSSGISTIAGTPGALTPGAPFEPRRSSAIVGIQPDVGLGSFPNYTSDLDVQFRQNSFDLTVPTIGGLGSDMGQFGFAILSDIEASFLINAVQGDQRTNVLNAPKVTLFNGQQAFVADAIQMPFVISVIPVVGEFAAAQQPVIVVLSEGTLMSIQAVVSDDRRYVRLTVVPFFSSIGDISTFTFEGSSSSTSSTTNTTDADDDGTNESASDSNNVNRTVGTTVQLPTFQFVAVVTTVSVPDGGTVLLGGIKRLSEGRSERGIPLLSKVPYVNRLFRNVGIGRTTDSLMMMVTPRIIIQEEEEERLGISSL